MIRAKRRRTTSPVQDSSDDEHVDGKKKQKPRSSSTRRKKRNAKAKSHHIRTEELPMGANGIKVSLLVVFAITSSHENKDLYRT